MGMYTEVVLGFALKPETPVDVAEILTAMVEGSEYAKPLPAHPFFECCRWRFLTSCSSHYFGFCESHSTLRYNSIAGCLLLSVRASIKNYDDEIQKFVDWIMPWVDEGSGVNNLLGYMIYEEAETPTLFYKREARP